MKIFKNYKKLYLNELENRKKLINQISKISAENVEFQKEIRTLKERCASLTIDIGDIDGILEQETRAKEELKKERTKLRREITMLKKELNKDGE